MSRFSVELSAPVPALFDYLADPRHRPDWQSSIVELSVVDDVSPREGMRWKERARGFGRFDMEITEYRRNERWAERGVSPRGEIDLALDFAIGPSPDSTRLTVTLELRLRGVFAATRHLAPFVLRPLMSADLRRAAQLAVAGPPRGS